MKKLITIITVICVMLCIVSVAGAGALWGTGSPDWASGASGPSPVIFKFDTSTGGISMTFSFGTSNWMWIGGLADSGRYLYASHNTYDIDPNNSLDTHDFKIAKINRYTGAVLSDTSIAGFLGQTYSQVNALDFVNGKLYAVENATSGSTIRGYAIEVLLNTNGDVVGATKGALVGPYPDCGLDYYNGLWYATSWGYTNEVPRKEGSLVYTSPDIMNTNFTQVGTSAVKGIGMIDGWEFDKAGNLFAVTWYNVPKSATAVYSIDKSTWTATLLYDLSSQLPSSITQLNGLSQVMPNSYSCVGFEPPMDKTVIVTKPNRVLPLKMVCKDAAGKVLTDLDIAPPIVDVDYNGNNFIPEVVSEALFAGQGDEGNQFVYSGNYWQFNLQTKNFSGTGVYGIKAVSGDTGVYVIDPPPLATFEIRVK